MNDNFSIFETKFGENAIISFDLFDTLIEEPFSTHQDMFDLMNADVDRIIGKKNFDFKKVRILAEKNALKIHASSKIIDLNDIYFEFQRLTQLGNAYVMEIEKLELVYIQKNYKIKPIGKQIYEIAESLNKKIVIVADTYYPRFAIESILDNCEYRFYHDLFITSELQMNKDNNSIYQYLSEKLQCSTKYIMHIGDDEKLDSINPKKLGYNVLSIFSTKESYQNTYYYKNIWKETESSHILSTRLINGLLSMKFFEMTEEQAIQSDKYAFNQQFSRLGYFGLGPILLGYTQWILQKSQEDYVKHLYFPSSNGKFLKQAYDLLSKHYSQAPTSYELLASNTIQSFVNLHKNNELYELLDIDYLNVSIKDFFLDRFNLDVTQYSNLLERYGLNLQSNISKHVNEKQVEAIFEYLKPAIMEQSKNSHDYYAAYLKYQHLPNPDKSAIVDICNQDNIQLSLSDIVKQKIGGYYLLTFVDMIENIKKQDIPVSGYVSNFDDKKSINKFLNLIFSSSEHSFVNFDLSENTINPIFEKAELNKDTQKALETIQSSALKFVSDFEALYSKNITQMYFSSKQLFKPLDYILNKENDGIQILKTLSTNKEEPTNNHEISIQIDSEDRKEHSIKSESNINIFDKIGNFFVNIKKAL